MMYRLAYRNFGDHESLVVNDSVTVGSTQGVRWYELRLTGAPTTPAPTVFQQGTYSPDATSRWMGSIAMDKAGDIAVGYSKSSRHRSSIAYTGRLQRRHPGQMTQGEAHVLHRPGSQTGTLTRWGDYSTMTVDPTDDCTFWFTSEYLPADGTFNWSTRIGSFAFPSCGPISLTPTAGTVAPGASTSAHHGQPQPAGWATTPQVALCAPPASPGCDRHLHTEHARPRRHRAHHRHGPVDAARRTFPTPVTGTQGTTTNSGHLQPHNRPRPGPE